MCDLNFLLYFLVSFGTFSSRSVVTIRLSLEECCSLVVDFCLFPIVYDKIKVY